MKQTCSRNLTRHIQLLKAERNRLLTLHDNGYKITPEDYTAYIQHKNYVTELLHKEKMESYTKLLCKSR